MKINLRLQLLGGQNIIPINYQYEFSAWIYKTFHFGNAEFAEWLHEKGYFNKKKQFKLFSFSNLQFEGRNAYSVSKDRLILHAQYCDIQLTTILPNALEHFIQGLFAQQEFEIGDKQSRVKFCVEQVRIEPILELPQRVQFKALSPICVAVSTERDDGKRQAQYQSPEDEGYWDLVRRNLENKWEVIEKLELLEADSQQIDWQFRLLGRRVKQRLVHIKVNTAAHTKVRAYLYNFEITAPRHFLQTAYLCGLGEKNSQGFGCIEPIILDDYGNNRD